MKDAKEHSKGGIPGRMVKGGRKSFTAKDTKEAKENKSLNAKGAKETKEQKSSTAKEIIIRKSRTTPKDAKEPRQEWHAGTLLVRLLRL